MHLPSIIVRYSWLNILPRKEIWVVFSSLIIWEINKQRRRQCLFVWVGACRGTSASIEAKSVALSCNQVRQFHPDGGGGRRGRRACGHLVLLAQRRRQEGSQPVLAVRHRAGHQHGHEGSRHRHLPQAGGRQDHQTSLHSRFILKQHLWTFWNVCTLGQLMRTLAVFRTCTKTIDSDQVMKNFPPKSWK